MSDRITVTTETVAALIADQFPQWAGEAIAPVATMGWDNRTFRLGADKLVRLPSGPGYAAQPGKEWQCLPHLAVHLPVPVPKVLGEGNPGQGYPYHWSILSYLEGVPAAPRLATSTAFAEDLAAALRALRTTPIGPGPAPGMHNFHRGGDVRIYDQDLRKALDQLGASVDRNTILKVWTAACHSQWTAAPVWVHGDIAMGNLLARDDRLAGLIDFGCCAVGDPACDLTIAWTLFDGPARDTFRKAVGYDTATWARARGWAVWKAALESVKGNTDAKRVIISVCAETAALAATSEGALPPAFGLPRGYF